MTISIDEARAWLAANAPEWHLRRARTGFTAGTMLGDPTSQLVEVQLTDAEETVTLVGEGATILGAVQVAVGALRRDD